MRRWERLFSSITVYLPVRVGLSLWAVLVLVLIPARLDPDPLVRPYLGSEPVDSGLVGWILGPWQRFDTLRYIHLAREGYQPQGGDSVFFPLYPLLIRAVGGLLGGSAAGYLCAALLISNLACLGYFVAFLMLAQAEVGEKSARRAQIYMALYPWVFILLAAYTESLSLLLVAVALLASRRGYGWLAGLCGALAALTRISGALLVFPLSLEVLLRRSDGELWPPRLAWFWPPRLDMFWAVLPASAAIGFQLWRRANGLPPTGEVYAIYWHQTPVWPWESFGNAVRLFYAGTAHLTDYLDFTVGLFFIGLTAIGWFKLSHPCALYLTAILLLNISQTRTLHPISGLGRHTIEMFPAFFVLAQIAGPSPWLNRLILYSSLLLLLWLSGQFFVWGWIG